MDALEQVRQHRKSGREQFLKLVRDLEPIPPAVAYRLLEEHGYRGQAAGRRALCLMAYRHVQRIRRLYVQGMRRDELLPKANHLLLGPTGCGKTFIVELLFGKLLKLPTVVADITSFSETGYVGHDVNTILTRLLHAAGESPLLASIGVVCLDEFDKIASGQNNAVFAGAGTTKDVTGLGVQRELLKLLEASEVVVPLEMSAGGSYGDHVVMSTADIAFVAAGAFSGLPQVLRRRGLAGGAIGFGRAAARAVDPDAVQVSLAEQDVEEVGAFHSYGFLPELMARFARVVPFEALSRETLREILDDAVLGRLRQEFEEEGFALEVAPEVLDHVVGRAMARQTGARGLGAALTRIVEEAAFEHFGREREGRVRVLLEAGRPRVIVD